MSSHEYFVFHSFGDNSSDNWVTTKIDPYEDPAVRDWDQKLHRALSKIIRKHSPNSHKIKQLLRFLHSTGKKRTNEDSIYQLILKQEPALGKLLPKRNKLSLLWITILGCYQDSAELLVRSGADVNWRLRLKFSPGEHLKKSTILHALLKMYPSSWNERLINLVMDHGANLKARDSECASVLHVAVEYGRVKVAERLLEKGADVNARDFSRMTPLLDAVRTNKAGELVPLLIRHGADVKAKDINEKNAFHYLTMFPGEHVDVARVLIENGVSCVEEDSYGYPPIIMAIGMGMTKLVNFYLDHGVDVNGSLGRIFSDFPLHYAAMVCEDPAMLQTLLRRGANIDLKNSDGETALYLVVYWIQPNNKETVEKKVKILLSVGADMFAKCHDDLTPFDYVSHANYLDKRGIDLFLKTLALRKAHPQSSIEFKDDRITKFKEKYPEHWNHYQDRVEELDRTKSTKLIGSCTFFDLLTKCQCQMLALMRYREFESKFRLYDLSVFPIYAEDLLEAFDSAERYYRSVLKQEDLIHEAVYNILPHMVVRKVVSYNLDCEICELKKIVQASRGM